MKLGKKFLDTDGYVQLCVRQWEQQHYCHCVRMPNRGQIGQKESAINVQMEIQTTIQYATTALESS